MHMAKIFLEDATESSDYMVRVNHGFMDSLKHGV